jgi:uncharacterized protein (TIGR03083 family)
MTDALDGSEIEPIVTTLIEEWASIEELLDGLDEKAWDTPTALPGWTVHDVVAHLIGTESRLAGEEPPPFSTGVTDLAYVRNAVGEANEHWVRALRRELPAEMLRRFRSVTKRRTEALTAMTRAEFDSPTATPVGQATYRRFMEIRVFDCWVHEQDIRQAVGRPGHEDGLSAEASIDEVVRALGFIVGKQAAAPDGSALTFELTGPVHRRLNVAVDGRAKVVADLDRPATATVRLPSTVFVRLASGRADVRSYLDRIDSEGDHDLAQRVALNLAFTI